MALGHAWHWLWYELPPAWFLSLVLVGAVYAAALSFRLLAYLALCLRWPTDLRRRYGTWAVVTGLTSGIGRSVAMELARRGLSLVLLDLDAGNLQEASDVIRARHAVRTKTVVFDLSLVGTAQGDEAMWWLRAAVDGLDEGVLVNNAGVARPYAMYLHEADAEAWVRMICVNLWAVTEVTAAVLPGMVERRCGAVVNIGSASSEAVPSFPLSAMYAATKRYVAQLSRSLYVEYKSKGIDVQCQAPFFVATRIMTGIELVSLLAPFVPTADAPPPSATSFCGSSPVTTAVGHDAALDWFLLRLSRRQRVVVQKVRASRAASASRLGKAEM